MSIYHWNTFNLQIAVKQSDTYHRKRGFPRFGGSGKATAEQQSNTPLARPSLQQYDESKTPVSKIEHVNVRIIITVFERGMRDSK